MIKIKPFKQSKGYCGPASLKMILQYYGINKSEEECAKITGTTREHGTSEARIVRTAKKLGLKVHIKENSSIYYLKKIVNKRIPVIVDWFSPEEAGHYSVVVGFKEKNIFLADPHFGKIVSHPIEWFDERWFDMPFKKIIKRGMIIIWK